jgi:hypothetical protein
MLHHACPEQLQSLFPSYQPAAMHDGLLVASNEEEHFPSSAFLALL